MNFVEEILGNSHPDEGLMPAGFSIGGILAYEAAQQLIAAGYKVPLVCLIDPTLPFFGANADGTYSQPDVWAQASAFRRFLKACAFSVFDCVVRLFRRIPIRFRAFYVNRYYLRACRNYHPSACHHRLVVFHRTFRNENIRSIHRTVWTSLSAGEVEFRELSAGHHGDLMRPPASDSWSEFLARQVAISLRAASNTNDQINTSKSF